MERSATEQPLTTEGIAPVAPARRRTGVLIALMVVSMALFCVLTPIHVSLYATPVVLALPLGAALGGAPLLAYLRPRPASVLACVTA